jgi:hypothetical protein
MSAGMMYHWQQNGRHQAIYMACIAEYVVVVASHMYVTASSQGLAGHTHIQAAGPP